MVLPAGVNRKLESPFGQNEWCTCYKDLCNNSSWLEWTKPTRRGPTTHIPTTREPAVITNENVHLTDQDGITRYISGTSTDSEGPPLHTDSEGVPMPTEGVKIQSNGVKALNGDMRFVTSLTLIIHIFCRAKN